MKSFVQLLFAASALFGYSQCAAIGKLPPNVKPCKLDAKRDACIGKAIENALVELVNGYKPLGIHSVDPLLITAIEIEQGSGPVSINLKFKNLNIHGLKNAKISNFKSSFGSPTRFTFKATFPKLNLDGLYTVDGKILVLPIKGDGKSKISLDDVDAYLDLEGDKIIGKDGREYLKINKFDLRLETKKLSMNLSNLFNGDKALGDNMNKFLNENSAEILKELKPAIQDTFGMAFKEISNRIFNKVPYEDIFPQN